MTLVKILPEQLMNQIAAGEVVERPASVVKEIVENSLDAGARRITVEVHGGGDSFMRITDDGCGMDKEDAVLAFGRHATSKISTAEDLINIRTLGFRGEALASIASVSYMTLQTKRHGDLEGTIVASEGGKITKIKPVGVPEGTQVEIRQLFYNTPARKKYLKNDSTEYQHIAETLTGIALSYHDVAFRLVHDDKVVFDLPAAVNHFTRIRELFGPQIADELIPVFHGHTRMQLEGFIGKPLIARSNRNFQYLFINRRPVRSHVLGYAVKQSYHSLLPKEKHPVFFLFFDLDPQLVDVNVHPRKLEVRFRDEKEIFSATFQACQKALESHVLAPHISGDAPVNYYQDRKSSPLTLRDSSGADHREITPSLVTQALKFTSEFTETAKENSNPTVTGSSGITSDGPFSADRKQTEELIPLAQLDCSYIICQQGSSLVIVDQHAAHERIRYTEIMDEFKQQHVHVQPLIAPLHLELSPREISILQEKEEFLKSLGFEMEAFGGKTYVVHAVPASLQKQDLHKTILGFLDQLDNDSGKPLEELKERSLTYLACRSAVKFGDKLAPEEQLALVKKLQTLDLPYTCPHGRPTMVILSAAELKKRFGRDYSF